MYAVCINIEVVEPRLVGGSCAGTRNDRAGGTGDDTFTYRIICWNVVIIYCCVIRKCYAFEGGIYDGVGRSESFNIICDSEEVTSVWESIRSIEDEVIVSVGVDGGGADGGRI